MKFKVFGFTKDEVDFAFVDFYTVGHFIFGYITYLIVYLLFWLLFRYFDPGLFITITINIGIFWEFFENFYLYNIGFKFDNRRDSFANSLTDILFVNIGGIVCGIISIFTDTMFITSLIVLVSTIALYEILRKITFNNENGNNNGKNMEKI